MLEKMIETVLLGIYYLHIIVSDRKSCFQLSRTQISNSFSVSFRTDFYRDLTNIFESFSFLLKLAVSYFLYSYVVSPSFEQVKQWNLLLNLWSKTLE